MMLHIQKHKSIRKVAYHSEKKTAKVLHKSQEKIMHFDLRQTENCVHIYIYKCNFPLFIIKKCYKNIIVTRSDSQLINRRIYSI